MLDAQDDVFEILKFFLSLYIVSLTYKEESSIYAIKGKSAWNVLVFVVLVVLFLVAVAIGYFVSLPGLLSKSTPIPCAIGTQVRTTKDAVED